MRLTISAEAGEIYQKRDQLRKALENLIEADLVKSQASGSAEVHIANPLGHLGSHVENRAVSTGGASNIIFNLPPGPAQQAQPAEGLYESAQSVADRRVDQSVKNQRRYYREQLWDLNPHQDIPVVPVELPEDYKRVHEDGRAGHAERKKVYTDYAKKRLARNRTTPNRLLTVPTMRDAGEK